MFELASTPRDLGEILQQGIGLGRLAYRRLFMLTSVIAFLGVVPTACLVWGAGDVPMPYTQIFDELSGRYGIAALLVALLGMLLRALMLNRVAAAARGQTYGLNEEFQRALRAWPWLVIAGFVYLVAVGLGTLLLLVPGLILAVSLMFEEFGVVLEGYGPIQALNASHNLVWGHWWRTLGLLILVFLPLSVLLAIVAALLGLDLGSTGDTAVTGRSMFGQAVLEMVFLAVFGPFVDSILYVYYHDLKLRKQSP